MTRRKQMPRHEWPEADQEAWAGAFATGDIFDEDTGPGTHLSSASRRSITWAYGRWLRFLAESIPEVLGDTPASRILPDRVRAYIDHRLDTVTANTVAIEVTHLYYAARLLVPNTDWTWLRSVKARLCAQVTPLDRFDRLIPPCQTLDHGIVLMETADLLPQSVECEREVQFRDGLLLALLSLWPIRRRSLTALTANRHVERHVEHHGDRMHLLLHAEDTKSGRAESFVVPDILAPFLERYLDDVRPRLARSGGDAFWMSCRGNALSGNDLYVIVKRRTYAAFGRAMGLHDFRRTAATYLAMDAPEKIGLIPGVLQHVSPEVAEQHYNLARSTKASQRHGDHVSARRDELRGVQRRQLLRG